MDWLQFISSEEQSGSHLNIKVFTMGKNLGEYFGGVSGMTITLSYNSVFNKSCKDNKLKKKIDIIKSIILYS